jgi:uncharacterized Zn-binding protein involved in type VI secretion
MAGNVRFGDIWVGICCCHANPPCIGMTGPVITFSTDTNVNGRGQARLGDMVIGFCGHPGIIVSASPDSSCNGRGMARVGDAVVGCTVGVLITGSPDMNSN